MKKGKKKEIKRFVVTSISTADVNWDFLDALLVYCKHNQAQLQIVPTKNLKKYAGKLFLDELSAYTKTQNFRYNANLKLITNFNNVEYSDVATGLQNYQKESLILPTVYHRVYHLKRDTRVSKHPAGIFGTGSINHPISDEYITRKNELKLQEIWVTGAAVVEIEDDKKFHIRQLTWKENCFYDIAKGRLKKYSKKGVSVKGHRLESICLGDSHAAQTDPEKQKININQIKKFNPKAVTVEDVFDGVSVSHHTENQHLYRANTIIPLEEELKITAKYLNDIAKHLNGKLYVKAANHDEHLDRYLEEGRYIYSKDTVNMRLAHQLAIVKLDGKNVCEAGMNQFVKLSKKVKFLSRTDVLKIKEFICSSHGDGFFRRFTSEYITGHTHTASISLYGHTVVGVSKPIGTANYVNHSNLNDWTQTDAFIYPNGTRSLITIIDGKYYS